MELMNKRQKGTAAHRDPPPERNTSNTGTLDDEAPVIGMRQLLDLPDEVLLSIFVYCLPLDCFDGEGFSARARIRSICPDFNTLVFHAEHQLASTASTTWAREAAITLARPDQGASHALYHLYGWLDDLHHLHRAVTKLAPPQGTEGRAFIQAGLYLIDMLRKDAFGLSANAWRLLLRTLPPFATVLLRLVSVAVTRRLLQENTQWGLRQFCDLLDIPTDSPLIVRAIEEYLLVGGLKIAESGRDDYAFPGQVYQETPARVPVMVKLYIHTFRRFEREQKEQYTREGMFVDFGIEGIMGRMTSERLEEIEAGLGGCLALEPLIQIAQEQLGDKTCRDMLQELKAAMNEALNSPDVIERHPLQPIHS